jgi:SP family general alpha glucoside:H+ symporter-like MFS transporter
MNKADYVRAHRLSVGGTGMALVGTLISWFALMPYFGRRTILMLIGILNVHTSEHSFGMTQAVLTLVWTFVFQLSVGQLGWGVPAEVGSTRLRQKTVCLARNAYYIVGVVANALEPYFMNPTQWNLKGYTGFVWGGTTFVMLIWGFFRLPETKGRSFDELDVLFAKKVSARKFKSTVVDTFDESETAEIVGNARG